MPAISVLMPVRDAGPWLAPALASLARQSFSDFEVVAVDDGSTDGSGERLERAARREPRLRVLRQNAAGLVPALNAALAAACSDVVARHDADDVSHRHRLARQYEALAVERGPAVMGCHVSLLPRAFSGIGMRRWVEWHNRLSTHDAMAREMLVDSPLAHGTSMMRRETLARVGGWRDAGWAEDLDLWLRLLEGGARFHKVPATLYAWRQHAASATRRDPRYHQTSFDALRLHALERGLLRTRSTVSVVGVGASLERWRAHLARAGHGVTAFAAARPSPMLVAGLTAPALLVFGAAPARQRWRAALEASGRREGGEFTFVA